MLLAAEVVDLVAAFGAVGTVMLTASYVYLTYRLLERQTAATEANVFTQLRQAWNDLDTIMLEYGKQFQVYADKPIHGLILPTGVPNPDPRLYVAYRFFGTVEMMILLRDEFGLARSRYIDSFHSTMEGIMSMAVMRQLWEAVKHQYSPAVCEYVEWFIGTRHDLHLEQNADEAGTDAGGA